MALLVMAWLAVHSREIVVEAVCCTGGEDRATQVSNDKWRN